MEINSSFKKKLLLYKKNAELLRLVRSSLDSKVCLLQKRKKKNLEILTNLRKQQLLLLAILDEKSIQRSLWKLNRQSTFWEFNCHCNDDQFFKRHFRMTRTSFDILCGLLGKLNKVDTKWQKAITLQKRVAIALFTLGSSGEYRVVSELFGVGKSTVCTILIEFCEEVWQVLSTQYIKKLPPTEELRNECVDGFQVLGFPQCLGAIDGCHIEVKLNQNDATDYYNYKGWYSIVLLALVDYRYRFLYINVGAPGRCNDSQIFNSSKLKRLLDDCEILKAKKKEIGGIHMPVCILAHSAFRFSTSLMKPYAFSLALSDDQKLFNYRLSKCRRVVENAFGHLKARFRRVGKGIDNRVGNAPIIVRACCVLHNFLNERNDHINQLWLENVQNFEINRESPAHNVTIGDKEPTAEVIRQTLCSYFSSDVLGPGDGEHGDSGEDGADNGVPGDSAVDELEISA